MEKLLVGADPEVFVADQNGYRSAIGLLNGSKYDPRPVGAYSVLEDNVLAEYNIPPCSTVDEFLFHIKEGLKTLASVLPEGIFPKQGTSVFMDPQWLNDPKAKEFGCDTDYNAWTYMPNEAPDPENTNLRTAGGHIHIGYEDPDDYFSINLIKVLDLYLGVPSILLDSDKDRRSLYGKAGCFRIKSYGVEYRSLSNFWIHNENYIRWVFEQTKAAVNFIRNNAPIEVPEIRECIDTSNVDLAKQICEHYNIKTCVESMDVLAQVNQTTIS